MRTPIYLPGQEREPVNPSLDLPSKPLWVPDPGYWEEAIRFRTNDPVSFMDMNSLLQRLLEPKEIDRGMLELWNLHTTSGLLVNEYEENLMADLRSRLEVLYPKNAGYRHNEQPYSGCTRANAHAHLWTTASCQQHLTIPISSGALVLGPYQNVIYAEFDGPRQRTLYMRTWEYAPKP